MGDDFAEEEEEGEDDEDVVVVGDVGNVSTFVVANSCCRCCGVSVGSEVGWC